MPHISFCRDGGIVNRDYHADKLGFYTVGDFRTYSKMEAIELQKTTGIHLHWNFNDEEFESYDWTVEPPESLWELYTQRAWQIRNQYDYLVLNYSGGADSDMFCRVFLENNIPFEEMISCRFGDVDTDLVSLGNREVTEIAKPRAEAWLAQGYKFKYRIIDYGGYVVDAFKDPDWLDNWIYYFNNNYGLTRIARSMFRDRDRHYLDLFDRGIRVGFVNGMDKPRLYQHNGKYSLRFLDMVDNIVPVRCQMYRNPYCFDELFYWSPDAKDLLCKQGHVLMNFFKKKKELWREFQNRSMYQEQPFKHLAPEDIWKDSGNSVTIMKNSEIVHHLIYPGYRPQAFNFKSQISFYSIHDEVFRRHPDTRSVMSKGVEKLKSIDPYWIQDGDMKLCISEPYYLEK